MNESNQTIESLLAQLPEERLPNEWLFSIQMGIILTILFLIALAVIGYFVFKKYKIKQRNQAIINHWLAVFNDQNINDQTKIVQANSAIKLHIKSTLENDDHINLKTLNGQPWAEFISSRFSNINKNTLELLANSHYQATCNLTDPAQFNNDVIAILKECLND